jgi:hypothetical protein
LPVASLPPAVAAVFDDDDTEPGEWVTWSDAALDPDAEAFEPEVAARVAPDSLAITEIIEIVSLTSAAPATEVSAGEVSESHDEVESDEPDLVVTESMAELFLKQGHAADALRIYRELLARRPEDDRLAARVASLAASAPAHSDTLPAYAASSSGGTSVRELMRSVLGSRPNGLERGRPAVPEAVAAGPDAPGTPTRPAADHLTLSAIFGEDASPMPPMSRKPRMAGAPPAEQGGVSFDEFYGGPPSQGNAPRSAGSPEGAPGEDDLDQFHDWLQNLKR